MNIPKGCHHAWLWMVIAALLLLASNGVCQGENPTISLSRPAAINMAIRNNIDLRVRALDSSLAENSIKGSKAIYNPSLTASIDYARTNVAGEDFGTETTSGFLAVTQTLPTGASVSLAGQTGPTSAFADPLFDYTDWSSAVGITIYQPLLKNAGKRATELGITQDIHFYRESLETFRENVIDTVFSVISEYNRLYVLRQLLQSREDAVRSAQQLLEELRTKPSPGDNPEIELANAEYTLSQRQTDLIEAERQVSSKEASLRYLIGVANKVRVIPLDPPSREEPPETEDQAIALALGHRPDLENLRIQLQANEEQRKVAKRNLWPDLAVTASGGYRGYAQDGGFSDTVDQIGDGKGRYWAAGLRLTYPLGNDLAESEYRQRKTRSEQLQNQITASEWQVRDTIREDNRSLLSARLQMLGTSKSRTLAEQRVAQYQKNRRRGAASVKDLLDAENDLISARNLELNAIENFAFLVARLWKDIGVLLERQNIHVDLSQPEQVSAGTSTEDLPALPPLESAAVTAPPAQTDRSAGPESYTLMVGTFVSSEIESAKKKIRLAGLTPVVLEGPKAEREVIRLLLGEYPNLQSAREALEPLKSTHSEGFILKNESHRYEAYAGSFFSQEGAEAEQQRLAPLGIRPTLKKVQVILPTQVLTAGSFSTREAAQRGLGLLEQQGLTAEVLTNRH